MTHLKYILIILTLASQLNITAQTTDDALRFAVYQPMGTARSMAIGNALSSLGGDFFTMSHNPAGLASYRTSELTWTQGLQATKTTSALQGSSPYEEVDLDYMFTSLGLVVASTNYQSKWKAVNFGIGYNRNTNFNGQSFYQGNTEGSITDSWLEEYDNSDELLPYSAGLAADADVFIEDGQGNVSTDYRLDGAGPLLKRESITSTGGSGEMTVGFAANYDHKLYFGLTIGVPIINYEQKRTYEEAQEEMSPDIYFRDLQYEERLEQSGSGVNAKFGMIYRLNQAIRFSAYYHTPTVLSILDEFDNRLEYSYFDVDRNPQTASSQYPPPGEGRLNFEYQVITPGQVGGGASVLMGNNGFISAEVSYLNYASTRFDFDSDLSTIEDLEYERELNQAIDVEYGGAWNFRLGGELAIDALRFRAGAILNQRPYANDSGFDPTFTAGFGVRLNKFFIDLAYRRYERSSSHIPYLTNDQELYPIQEASQDIVDSDIFLTVGFKFN